MGARTHTVQNRFVRQTHCCRIETNLNHGSKPRLMLAYLVIREGSKWTDVFRLVEGRTVTIGRAPTNQIVVKDERCSRHHAEIFISQGNWILRDLDSRNGTMIGEERIKGDRELAPGEIRDRDELQRHRPEQPDLTADRGVAEPLRVAGS